MKLVKNTNLLNVGILSSSLKPLRWSHESTRIGWYCNNAERRYYSKKNIEPSENFISNPPGIQTHPPSVLARSLLELRKSGSFSTVTVDPADSQMKVFGTGGVPYILLHNIAKTPSPVFTFRSTQKHTEHIQHSPNASLALFPLTPRHIIPTKFGLWMINFSGKVSLLENTLRNEAKNKFFIAHPGIQQFLEEDDNDFHYYAFHPEKITFKERDKTTAITLEEFENSQVDEVMRDSAALLKNLNENHVESLIYLIQEYANIDSEEVFVYAIDKFGLNVVTKNKSTQEWTDVRIPFPFVMNNIEECEESLLNALTKLKEDYTKEKIC
eukprot:TRINITY_DN1098_c0_g2_i1.p1 TRINITY_DN1098_c0_g2~~TRINITY_DN1098_c0_g2_i1.p1  ORF type:complete len:326 (+),score=63.23 TRINITY_DN1098_c0_g2_i1:659-1636(+)